MLKLVKNKTARESCSIHCALFMLCKKSLDDDGSITEEMQEYLRTARFHMLSLELENLKRSIQLAMQCKKQKPFYHVENVQQTKCVVVGKWGRVTTYNSFWEFIGFQLLGFLLFAVLIGIIAGICDLFS